MSCPGYNVGVWKQWFLHGPLHCTDVGISDGSGEPDWRTHILGCGAGKGKKLFAGIAVLSDCVSVSNHAAAVWATIWEWE